MVYNYGERLKEWRKNFSLNRNELARKTGISRQNIERWEEKNILPSIDFCVRLADFYGITLDELIGRKI